MKARGQRGTGKPMGRGERMSRGSAAATKSDKDGCCAMGAETGRGDGGTRADGGALDNGDVDGASEARDQG